MISNRNPMSRIMTIMTLVVALACVALSIVWPQWRAELGAQSYGYGCAAFGYGYGYTATRATSYGHADCLHLYHPG
jgi:hypothetical protein